MKYVILGGVAAGTPNVIILTAEKTTRPPLPSHNPTFPDCIFLKSMPESSYKQTFPLLFIRPHPRLTLTSCRISQNSERTEAPNSSTPR